MTLVTSFITTLASNPTAGAPSQSQIGFIAPAGATAYAAFDAISNSVGTPAALSFPQVGRSGKIVSAHMMTSAVPSAGTGKIDLMLFETEPTNVADNGAAGGINLASMADKYVGTVTFDTATQILDVASFVTWPGALSSGQLTYQNPVAGSLYGLLVCRATFTFGANTTFIVRLGMERW